MKDGYHVLCEKPMARDVKLADQMIEVSEKTKKIPDDCPMSPL